MTGYKSIKDYFVDARAYACARDSHLKRKGMDIEKLMKKRLKERLEAATPAFKKELRDKKLTEFDLQLIAANELREYDTFREFYQEAFYEQPMNINNFKKIIKSQAFKQGKLSSINKFIPLRINTKRQFVQFVRKWQKGITDEELDAVMSIVGTPDWIEWFEALQESDRVNFIGGRWFF